VYVFPVVLVILLAIVAGAMSPPLAVVIAGLLFIALLAYARVRQP
jgi:hypothetical protein